MQDRSPENQRRVATEQKFENPIFYHCDITKINFYTQQEFANQINKLDISGDKAVTLIIDLEKVESMTWGFRLLIQKTRELKRKKNGSNLILLDVQEQILKKIIVDGYDEIFEIRESERPQ